MSRSLNKVILIGNLTRDVELRYTPQGAAVAAFGVATNRQWKVADQVKEATEFHNIVAWNKLAEQCNQFLAKGRLIYAEGRLKTRTWDGQDGQKHYRTEIIASRVTFLDRDRPGGSSADEKEEAPAGDIEPDDIPF